MITSNRRSSKWWRTLMVVSGAGLVIQQGGCAIDPDLLLQATTQFLTEFAIFITDNALVGLR